MATQDANRELVKRGYQPSVADLNIAQDTPNPAQQPQPTPDANKPQGEAPANAAAALAFDESNHPRADDGKFGEGGGGGGKAEEMGAGADGKPKKVSEMSKGELKTHGMRKKLEALRAKNAEGAKKLADTNTRVSELHSQLVEQLKAGTGTANDDLKKTVSELGAKIAETKMHTQTIQHALRGEDIAADEHGQDSPEHEAARKRTEYVAKLADFDESKHHRADDGKFGSGGGGAKKEDAPAKPSGNGGEGDGIDSKIASVRDGKGSMEFFHGTRMKNADLHIGKTFTDNQETADNYASEKTFQGNVDVSGLKIAKVKRFDREDANYGAVGDTDDDIADLQERGIDLIEYDDEDPSNKEHSAYRIVSDKALERFKDGVSLRDNKIHSLAEQLFENELIGKTKEEVLGKIETLSVEDIFKMAVDHEPDHDEEFVSRVFADAGVKIKK